MWFLMCFYFLFCLFTDFIKIKFHTIYHLQNPNTLTPNNNDTDCESVFLFIISFIFLSFKFQIIMIFSLLIWYWNHRILKIHFCTKCEVWTLKTPNDVHSANVMEEFKQFLDATIGNILFSITKCSNVFVIKKILLLVYGFKGVDVVLIRILTNIFKPNDHITRTHRC